MSSQKEKFTTIEEYIGSFPDDIQIVLQEMRETIKEAAPEAEEAISYQMPTFKLNGNLVHFAAYKKHIGFYPTPSGIDAFRDELAPYDLSKGTIKFALDKPIPFDLVRKIVTYRAAEQMEK